MLAWPEQVSFSRLRRLQIAAESSSKLAFLFRPESAGRGVVSRRPAPEAGARRPPRNKDRHPQVPRQSPLRTGKDSGFFLSLWEAAVPDSSLCTLYRTRPPAPRWLAVRFPRLAQDLHSRGQSSTDARPGRRHEAEQDETAERQAVQRLAAWCYQYSGQVCIPTDRNGLFLEARASERLFGRARTPGRAPGKGTPATGVFRPGRLCADAGSRLAGSA